MKRLVPVFVLGFVVTLAVVIGERMSTDAMAVVIGVAVGIMASVPTSLLLVSLLRRERQNFREESHESYGTYPPALPQQPPPNIIVLDPSQYANMRMQNGGYPIPPPDYLPDARNNGAPGLPRVVGGDDAWNSKPW